MRNVLFCQIDKKRNRHVPNGSSCTVFWVGDFNGPNKQPNRAQFKTIADSTISVPRQPYCSIKKATSGAKTNVPSPEPETAIPFHSDRKEIFSN